MVVCEVIEMVLCILCAVIFTYGSIKNPYKEVRAMCEISALAWWICVVTSIAKVMAFSN